MDAHSRERNRGVPLPNEILPVFRRSQIQARPTIEKVGSLPSELWFEILAFLCLTFAYGPQIDDRLQVLLPDLADFEFFQTRDYKAVVDQRNILR